MSAIKGSKELNKEAAGETIDGEQLAQETESLTPEEGADVESDAGKLKQLLGVLKKVIGVKDLANLRLSLPANLMEPQGNLEYWHYLDRPDLFAAIGDREIDPLARFIAIVRWTLSKDLRFVRGRVCKPYNSALGEQFRCAWEVLPASTQDFAVYHDIYVGPNDPDFAAASASASATASPAPSINRSDLPKSMSTLSLNDTASPLAKTKAGSLNGTASAGSSIINADGTSRAVPSEACQVAFLNEQVCHHPPISAFWYESTSTAKLAGVRATGVDQIAAKFNGTSVKIGPGSQNKGIFVTIPEVGPEEYQITHPGGYITGFISRAPYITLSDSTFINTLSASKGKVYRAIINYPDESWISKPRFLVEGVIYETDAASSTEYTAIKKVPESAVVARIKGSWRGKITIKKTKDKTESLLMDVTKLDIVPKSVRELEKQDPMESRKFWEPVSIAINKKDYKQATAQKQAIEQAQREKAAERTKKGEEFVPAFFEADISTGRGKLTSTGKSALDEELQLKDHPR